jgi:lysozyme
MRTSEIGLKLIRDFEGLRLQAYHDLGGVLTIGYGHTGPDVHEGLKIDVFQAAILLRSDVAAREPQLSSLLKVAGLTRRRSAEKALFLS